jgi:hypothetical protein
MSIAATTLEETACMLRSKAVADSSRYQDLGSFHLTCLLTDQVPLSQVSERRVRFDSKIDQNLIVHYHVWALRYCQLRILLIAAFVSIVPVNSSGCRVEISSV